MPMGRQSTRTDTQRTFENQREITNHGQTTHGTKHGNDFSRTKGTLRIEKTTHETKDETDFSKDNWTAPMLMRLTPMTIRLTPMLTRLTPMTIRLIPMLIRLIPMPTRLTPMTIIKQSDFPTYVRTGTPRKR